MAPKIAEQQAQDNQVVDVQEEEFEGFWYQNPQGEKCWTPDFEESIGE